MRWLIRHTPPGIVVSPFEFAFNLAYAVASGKIVLDIITHQPDLAIRSIPFQGWLGTLWAVVLFVGTATTTLGLLTLGRRTIAGLQLERGGLLLAASALLADLAGVLNEQGYTITLSITLLSLFILAFVFKALLIGRALSAEEERRK